MPFQAVAFAVAVAYTGLDVGKVFVLAYVPIMPSHVPTEFVVVDFFLRLVLLRQRDALDSGFADFDRLLCDAPPFCAGLAFFTGCVDLFHDFGLVV